MLRTSFCAGWRLPMLVMLLVVLGMPIRADKPPIETELNHIKLNSQFTDVLEVMKGAPAFIGPALPNIDAVMSLMQAPAPTESFAVPGPLNVAPTPGRPSIMTGSSMPAAPASASSILPQENLLVWLYPNHGWNMYVFLNQRGRVVGVVVAAANANVQTHVETEGHVHIGTQLMEIVGNYDWPDPFTTVGTDYYCNYPECNVTYGLEQRSHQVISIAVGLPLVVL